MPVLFFNVVLLFFGVLLTVLLITTSLTKNEFKSDQKILHSGIGLNPESEFFSKSLEKELRRLKKQLLITLGLLMMLIVLGLMIWH